MANNPETRHTVHGRTWDAVAARHSLNANIYRIGDGWAELVDRLLTDLVAMGWRGRPITRLEEKYGELCFEVGPGNPPSYAGWSTELEERVTEAERESDRTCSECGRHGDEVIIDSWVYKLCPVCASTRRAEYGTEAQHPDQ
jgi:hypothetical protein